jgi:glycine betaine/proline transport system ATP-binding protein
VIHDRDPQLVVETVREDLLLQTPKLAARHVYKVFGGKRERTLELLKTGASRADIAKHTGDIVAVNNVSFEVAEREIFVVMGLSGSGKSTLVRCINRLVEPTAGRVLLDGFDILTANEEELRQIRLEKVSMVFQHFALFPHKSVIENVEYGLKIQGTPREERRLKALEMLDQVGLRDWEKARPDKLSGGMRQRVGIARALVLDPTVLLMDEPFGALDPLIRREMQTELLRMRARFRGSIIFITHDLHEALTLGDRIAIMRDGAFVQMGSPAEIVDQPADEYVAAFTKDVDRGRVLTVQSIVRSATSLKVADLTWDKYDACSRATGCDAVFAVDERDAPVGILLGGECQSGSRSRSDSPEKALRRDFQRVRGQDSLASIYGSCRAELPIAVISPSGSLCGVVRTSDVWTAIADRRDGEPLPGLSPKRTSVRSQ